MRLRPGLRVLSRSDSEVQIGTDARWAVRLGGLGAGEVRLLRLLDDDPELDALVDRARACGVSAGRATELLDALQTARLTCRTPASSRPRVRTAASADAAVGCLLRDDGDGAALVRARAGRTVGVVGLGPLGLTVAVTLAAAGVGTVLLDDDGHVTSVDVGAAGYRLGDVGSSRVHVASRLVRDVAPDVRTEPVDGTFPDVVVLVERDAADPAAGLALMTAGMTHLSVVVREADALVGPLVVPGAGPCLRCVDLHRADVDDCWPTVVAQLAGREGRVGVLRGEVGVLAGLCGALAAAEVLAHLDGGSPATRGASYEVTLPDVAPRRRPWVVHPSCGCTTLTPTAPTPLT
ncbi:thiamine biosynthesis protein ThiF [Cellulomonas sp. WB94]|uniref:ThiF family adenylyltransferase n=1 Tax=Cellulomonas sp. WB94 TaxID=2173174 RepID=UPI000D56C5E6|nr:ThiF family adenylyltransferase [Cellulomonas sp. WB94]PVU82282.1 thiamine biosynthesis protein ThiF [Cellulomonas sp. WB94]